MSERKGTNNEGECFDLFQSTRLDCVSVEMIVGGAPHAITTGPLINIVDHTGTCCLYFKTQDAHVASLTSTKSDRREQKKFLSLKSREIQKKDDRIFEEDEVGTLRDDSIRLGFRSVQL